MDRTAVLLGSLAVIAIGALAPRDWESASFQILRQASAEPIDARRRLADSDLYSAEMVVDAWAQASRSSGPLRLNFTRWVYDDVFDGPDSPRASHGRVAASGRDCWEIEMGDSATCDEAILRVGTKLYLADPAARQLAVFDLGEANQAPTRRNWLASAVVGMFECQDWWGPANLLVDVDAVRLQNDFDILVVNVDAKREWIQLELQRRDRDSPLGPRVDVILDRHALRPVAVQVWQTGGRQRLVYRFDQANADPTVDVRATLREWESRYDSVAMTPPLLGKNGE